MVERKRKISLASVDITEQKKAEITLHSSKRSYRFLYKNSHLLLMNIPVCLAINKILYDEEGKPVDYEIIEVNKTYEKTISISKRDIVGKRYSELFATIDPQEYELRMDAYKEVILSRDSKVLPLCYFEWCSRWVSERVYSPEPSYFVSIYTDMTELKLTENELKKAKSEVEDTNRIQYELLANMSHEIRTLIHGIIGMLDLTLITDLSKEQEQNLKVVKNCADLLHKKICGLQDFKENDADNLSIDNYNIGFSIRSLLQELLDESSFLAVKKGLKLDYVCSSFVPQVVIGSPDQLKQVLGNLLDNALKFTEAGGVTISVTKIAKLKETIELRFSVTDTGIGISKEEQSQFLRPSRQTDGSISRNFNSIGLGLIVTRKIIQKMGGTIWVESESGSGSSFHFTLKFLSQEESCKKFHSYASLTPPMKPLQILVVEDDPINLTVLKRMLNGRGYEIETAVNGSEALVLHGQRLYDVILMDIQMPVMDGIEATVRIREKEGLSRHTPIIALTAYALQGDREKLLSYGMDEYISKPIQMEELLLKLEQVNGFTSLQIK